MKNKEKTQLKQVKDKGIISFIIASEKSITPTNQQKNAKKDRNR